MVIVILFVVRASQGPQSKAWEELATQTGLTFTPGTFTRRPSISGEFRGRNTRLYTVRRGTRRSRTTYTVLALEINNSIGAFLSISGEGLFSGIAKSLGMQDIQIDDTEFDSRFVIKSQPESFVHELFKQGSLRRHLLQARSLKIVLKEDQLIFEKRYVETDISYLLFLLDLLNHLAKACERITE